MKKIILLLFLLCLYLDSYSQNNSPNSVITLTTCLSNPNAIATDSVYIYWVEFGSGSIKKILNTGGAVTTIVSGLYSPKSLTLDNTDIYIGEDYGINSARIKKISKNGGTVTTLINNLYSIDAMVLDESYIYFCDFQGNTIQKIPKSGGTATTLSTQTYSPSGIVADANNVYWTEFTNPGTIKKVSKSGGATTTLSNNSNAIGIAVDNTDVFWTENVYTNLGKINRVSINGGSSSPIATGLNYAWHLCIDEFNVYWTENRTVGSVKQVSKNGGTVTIIENNINQPVCITADNLFIYWVERNGGSNGNLKKANKILTNINKGSSELPISFSLSQNYPNPFNPATKISFQLPVESFSSLKIFDITGKEISTLVNEKLAPGTYETTWDGSKFSSGIYFYQLKSGDFIETKRMMLIK